MKGRGSNTEALTRQSRGYANATAVLPATLLEQLQQHYPGLLRIPAPQPSAARRRELVIALHRQGIHPQAIAVLAGITPRRVQQILAGT